MFARKIETNCRPANAQGFSEAQQQLLGGIAAAAKAWSRLEPLYSEVKDYMKQNRCGEEKALRMIRIDLFHDAVRAGDFDNNPRRFLLTLLKLIP